MLMQCRAPCASASIFLQSLIYASPDALGVVVHLIVKMAAALETLPAVPPAAEPVIQTEAAAPMVQPEVVQGASEPAAQVAEEAPVAAPVPEPAALKGAASTGPPPMAKEDFKQLSDCFECNICLELASEPVVTLCGHLYCWPCLYRCVCGGAVAAARHGSWQLGRVRTALHSRRWMQVQSYCRQCPVCKAGVEVDKVIPIYGRGSEPEPLADVWKLEPLPPRPLGQRPLPVQASVFLEGFLRVACDCTLSGYAIILQLAGRAATICELVVA